MQDVALAVKCVEAFCLKCQSWCGIAIHAAVFPK
jgi:hypothetical protein